MLSQILNFLPKRLRLNKRKKIITTTAIISCGMLLATHLPIFLFLSYRMIAVLAFVAYVLSFWSLREGMSRIKALTLLILPTLFVIAVPNFYFVWPVRWLTRLPAISIFALSFYCLLLSQNVFNVASIRTIPLYRAASTVSFLFTIFTSFLLFHVLHVFSLPFYINGGVVALISFLLVLPVLWSVEMEDKISSKTLIYAFLASVIMGEFAIGLSFWSVPQYSFMWGVSLASVLFIILGIFIDFFRDRINKREIYLYSGFGAFVFTVILLTTSWSG